MHVVRAREPLGPAAHVRGPRYEEAPDLEGPFSVVPSASAHHVPLAAVGKADRGGRHVITGLPRLLALGGIFDPDGVQTVAGLEPLGNGPPDHVGNGLSAILTRVATPLSRDEARDEASRNEVVLVRRESDVARPARARIVEVLRPAGRGMQVLPEGFL